MNITILTLFPNMFDGFMQNSIIKRAITKKAVTIKVINIREYTKDRYRRVDTPPVGGG
ncbi:MAG: tRNA (guanosine(37)-N1)-methyltransferase TrmD, partial [Erysipelotrichia bacterium]|nr:tRNA (guanosine(37)-N1)-methyltransferase TrmD [Erysipelotrichia bacterium]